MNATSPFDSTSMSLKSVGWFSLSLASSSSDEMLISCVGERMAGVGAWMVLSGGAFGFLGTGGDGGVGAGGSVSMGSLGFEMDSGDGGGDGLGAGAGAGDGDGAALVLLAAAAERVVALAASLLKLDDMVLLLIKP